MQVFVTSGLGGMSGAQAKAGVITGCVTVVAEVIVYMLFFKDSSNNNILKIAVNNMII